MRIIKGFLISALLVSSCVYADERSKESALSYPVIDTSVAKFYGNTSTIPMPAMGEAFYGQDAQYLINPPSYTDNGNGTIMDNVTGLMWQKEMGSKLSFSDAMRKAEGSRLAGYDDWRIPSIKELYSLIQFTGSVRGQRAIDPFIDTRYFNQPLGNSGAGEREIDAQTWSATEYVARTMRNDKTVFGVNFVDGRIKGYPKYNPRTREPKKMYFRLVRGNNAYGKNSFVDNGNGTISDAASGLMWQQSDSIKGMNWQDALKYAQSLSLGGHSDWRLPSAKELQSIVDYRRSPETTGSPAIDPVFQTTSIINEGGKKDYPYFWSSTTHLDGPVPEASAAYIAFGRSLGKMRGSVMDVHGAGSQRSDPKTGGAMSRGPQGDMIRVKNYVRCVRGGSVSLSTGADAGSKSQYPDSVKSRQRFNRDGPQGSGGRFGPPSRMMGFVGRLDRNGDGKVSRSEFDGPKDRFDSHDENKDGYITENESPKGPPPRGRRLLE